MAVDAAEPLRLSFVEREAELNILKDKWALASNLAAPQPQLITLLGERGRGKTRLALEFYKWLSTEVDGQGDNGFWPDDFQQLEKNLDVNANFRACNRKVPIPYVWWGIRLPDQRGENAATGMTLQAHEPALTNQLAALYWKQQAFEKGKTIAGTLKDMAIDVADGLFEDAWYAKIAQGAFDIVDILVDGRLKNIGKPDHQHAIDRAVQKQQRSRQDIIIDDLRKAFFPLGKMAQGSARQLGMQPQTPGVIFIDDAQFIAEDKGFGAFFEKLLATAMAEKWPLMIITTHWEQEFLNEAERRESSYRGILDHGIYKNTNDKGPMAGVSGGFLNADNNKDLPLPPLNDLKQPLVQELPGLTEEQIDAILTRVDGNPRFLEQIMAAALEQPELFVDHDRLGPMEEQGFIELMAETTDIEKAVIRRLRRAPEHVKMALGLASKQGMRVVQAYFEELSEQIFEVNLLEGLKRAENPYRAIEGVANKERSVVDFIERLFFEASKKVSLSVKDFKDRQQEIEAALSHLVKDRLRPEIFAKLDPDTQMMTLALARSLFEQSADAQEQSLALQALAKTVELQAARFDLLEAQQNALLFYRIYSELQPSFDGFEPFALFAVAQQLSGTGQAGSEAGLALLQSFGAYLRERPPSPELNRLMSVVKAHLGDMYLAQSKFDLAQKAFDESLEIIRPLMAQLKTPQSIRDVSVSLNKLGDALMAQSEFEQAKKAFDESLEIIRPLMAQLKTPDSIRDVSISLEKVGDALMAQSEFEQAQKASDESLEIRRPLMAQLNTPDSIRDVSLSLEKVGDALMAQSEFEQAQKAFDESLEIRRPLMAQLKTPQSIRDVIVSLAKLAILAIKTDDQSKALSCIEEGEALASQLPPILRDPVLRHFEYLRSLL